MFTLSLSFSLFVSGVEEPIGIGGANSGVVDGDGSKL